MYRRILGALFVSSLLLPCTPAQGQPALYAGVMRTKGYVVGAPLSQSGLYRFGTDTSWVHVGWNHPRISAIAYDPTDSDVLYLAAGNGVLRTRDGGESWRITTDWEVTETQDIVVDPNAPEQVYVATAYGIWRSRDGGQTWITPDDRLPPDRKYTQALAIDRSQAGRVLAGTWDGLYVSDDAGESWSLAALEGVPVLDIEQSRADADVWFIGTQEHGALRSTDGGRMWQPARGALASEIIYSVATDPADPDNVAAAGWGTGVYVSTNGGRSWTQRTRGLPVPHIYHVTFDATRPGRLWAATVEEGIFRSDDLGRTWHYAGLDGTLVFDMVFIEGQQP